MIRDKCRWIVRTGQIGGHHAPCPHRRQPPFCCHTCAWRPHASPALQCPCNKGKISESILNSWRKILRHCALYFCAWKQMIAKISAKQKTKMSNKWNMTEYINKNLHCTTSPAHYRKRIGLKLHKYKKI